MFVPNLLLVNNNCHISEVIKSCYMMINENKVKVFKLIIITSH